MFSGRLPFEGYSVRSRPPAISELPRPQSQPADGRGFTSSIWKMMEKCWSMKPSARPSMDEIVDFFRRKLESGADSRPPDNFISPFVKQEDIRDSFMFW